MKRQQIATNLLGRRVRIVHPGWDREGLIAGGATPERVDLYLNSLAPAKPPAWQDESGEVVAVYVKQGILDAAVTLAGGEIVEDLPVAWLKIEGEATR